MKVVWSLTSDGGSSITSYIVLIQHADGTSYSTEPIDCDGTDPSIVLTTQCEIPISILRQAPFSLPWGSSVFAKVIAMNTYGNSEESSVGNGAVILTYPDAPVSLAEVYPERTKSSLGIEWSLGL